MGRMKTWNAIPSKRHFFYAPFMPPPNNSYRSFTANSAISPSVEGAHLMGDLIYLALGVVLFTAFGAYAWLLRGL
jgi:hypothetical protein